LLELYPTLLDFRLALSALVIIALGTIILSTVIQKELALTLMFIKVGLVVAYFGFFADGTWFYGGDDLAFFERGLKLFHTGRNPLTIWTHHEAIYLKTYNPSLSLIFFHNFLSIYLFGPYYHSPIMLNVLISAGTAVLLVRVMDDIFDGSRYRSLFVVFVCLHWTVVVWHSFLNLKEPFVALLSVLMIFFVTRFRMTPFRSVLGVVLTVLLLLRIRFYFPVFILGGVLLACLPQLWRHAITRPVVVVLGLVTLLVGITTIYQSEIRLFMRMADFPGFPYGVLHFVLQPAPWKITEPAGYLFLPSILNWVLFIPSCIGAYRVWLCGFTGRLLVGTVASGVIFYGLVTAVASTRHRMPLDMLVVVFQFVFVLEYGVRNRTQRRGFKYQTPKPE
jgi:hypothetical protein